MPTTVQHKKCANPNCSCPVTEGEYCGQACAIATREASAGMSSGADAIIGIVGLQGLTPEKAYGVNRDPPAEARAEDQELTGK